MAELVDARDLKSRSLHESVGSIPTGGTMTDQQFTIQQLRLDKIIYAVEATAVAVSCLVGVVFASVFFKGIMQIGLVMLLGFICLAYTLYMGLGNLARLRKIKQLEQQLSKS